MDFDEQASEDEREHLGDLTTNGLNNDFITDFFSWISMTQDERSPAIFRQWAGIATLAAAVERRVWVQTGMTTTYCHQYTMLVAPPGTGKGLIRTVRRILKDVKLPGDLPAFRVSPTNMTKASMVDEIVACSQTRLLHNGTPIRYSALFIGAEEFSALLSEYDLAYIGVLNELYNCDDDYRETRRGQRDKPAIVENPVVNVLTGIQPAFMANFFPEEAWSTGLARRITMVFTEERRVRDPFATYGDASLARQRIDNKLARVSEMYGPIKWAADGARYFRSWVLAGEPPVPNHSKLSGYNTTRAEKVIKLAALSAISRSPRDTNIAIDRTDTIRALEWLLAAERSMPDIFKSMLAKSDFALIEEMWRFVQINHARSGNRGVPGAALHKFIAERTTSDKVDKIIALAQRSNIIAQIDSIKDLWAPKAKHLHTLE